jgi:hypothetical protein
MTDLGIDVRFLENLLGGNKNEESSDEDQVKRKSKSFSRNITIHLSIFNLLSNIAS